MRIFEEPPLRNSFRLFFFFPFSYNFNPAPLAGELGARDTSRDLPPQPRSVRAAAGGQGGHRVCFMHKLVFLLFFLLTENRNQLRVTGVLGSEKINSAFSNPVS